jgi:hypothetical protein
VRWDIRRTGRMVIRTCGVYNDPPGCAGESKRVFGWQIGASVLVWGRLGGWLTKELSILSVLNPVRTRILFVNTPLFLLCFLKLDRERERGGEREREREEGWWARAMLVGWV